MVDFFQLAYTDLYLLLESGASLTISVKTLLHSEAKIFYVGPQNVLGEAVMVLTRLLIQDHISCFRVSATCCAPDEKE